MMLHKSTSCRLWSTSIRRHYSSSTREIGHCRHRPSPKSPNSASSTRQQQQQQQSQQRHLSSVNRSSSSSSSGGGQAPNLREEREKRRARSEREEGEQKKKEWKSIHGTTTSAPRQFLEPISSYISNVRLMVASRLTSSLPEEDRIRLLQSLNVDVGVDGGGGGDDTAEPQSPPCSDDNDSNRRTSIGEAVAVIEAKEASKTKLDDTERKAIWEKAEKAVMERVKTDISIQERRLALERWKLQLEREKKADRQRAEDASNAEQAAGECGEEEGVHPVLGPVLVDLGHKRVHVTSAAALSAVPVWEKQRVYRHDRAKVMASDKLKTLQLGLPGIVALHETHDGNLSILDGQHRVGMMSILQEKQLTQRDDQQNAIDLDRILVEVFPQPADDTAPHNDASYNDHAQDIFTEINKAEPVKLVDMPGVAKVTDRRIIDGAVATFAENYPDMFKPSQRCRVPHLNVDNLRDAIFAAGVLKRHSIRSQKALVEWIMMKNELVGQKYGAGVSAAEIKAKKHGFYLGLDLAWLYD